MGAALGEPPRLPRRVLRCRAARGEARLQPPAICWIFPIRVPATKLGSQAVSTTRCVRSPAACRPVPTRTALPESPKMPAPSQPNAFALPGQRDAGARRAAGADPDAVPVVPDGLRTGAGVGAARPGDDGHRRAHPAVEHRVDRDEREVVADAVVVADRDRCRSRRAPGSRCRARASAARPGRRRSRSGRRCRSRTSVPLRKTKFIVQPAGESIHEPGRMPISLGSGASVGAATGTPGRRAPVRPAQACTTRAWPPSAGSPSRRRTRTAPGARRRSAVAAGVPAG